MQSFVEISNIASLCLALNLAYLRMDRFLYRKSIQESAQSEFEKLNKEGALKLYCDTKYYKRLIAFSGSNEYGDTVDGLKIISGIWWKIYRLIFLHGHDRKILPTSAIISLIVILISSAYSIDLLTFSIPYWIVIIVWSVISISIIASVNFMLYGNRIVAKALEETQNCSRELEKFMLANSSKSADAFIQQGP